MMLKRVVKKGFNGRVKEWKTKHLRDAFMNGLLQARVTQEVKDAMVGHKRQGARADYAITEQTIKVAYESAFKFLTINGYGSTSRKLEQIEKKFDQQNKTLLEIMTELREENKQLKAEQQEFKAALEAIREAARKRDRP
jgi:cell division protein FtsB